MAFARHQRADAQDGAVGTARPGTARCVRDARLHHNQLGRRHGKLIHQAPADRLARGDDAPQQREPLALGGTDRRVLVGPCQGRRVVDEPHGAVQPRGRNGREGEAVDHGDGRGRTVAIRHAMSRRRQGGCQPVHIGAAAFARRRARWQQEVEVRHAPALARRPRCVTCVRGAATRWRTAPKRTRDARRKRRTAHSAASGRRGARRSP